MLSRTLTSRRCYERTKCPRTTGWPFNRSFGAYMYFVRDRVYGRRATRRLRNKRRKFDVLVSPANRYNLRAVAARRYCLSVAFDFRTMPSAFAGVFAARLLPTSHEVTLAPNYARLEQPRRIGRSHLRCSFGEIVVATATTTVRLLPASPHSSSSALFVPLSPRDPDESPAQSA